jgi:hypothetical protein
MCQGSQPTTLKNQIILVAGLLLVAVIPGVLAGPVMVLSPTTLNFGSTSTELWFRVNNTGGYPELSYSVTSQLPPWLTVNPMSADFITPGECVDVKVTVTRNGMGPSDGYSHDIAITSNGGNGLVHVYMTVPGLTIGSTSGGSVTNPGEGNFNFSYGEIVSLVASTLTGYQFTGWMGDTSSVADPGSATTTVTVYGYHQLTATFSQLPIISVQPQNLSFGTVTTELFVNIGNSGGSSLNWELEQDLPTWLSFPESGAAGAGQTLPYMAAVDRSALNPGIYTHTMYITSNGGSCEVGVTMEVPESEPEAYTLNISSTQGGRAAIPGEGLFHYPLDTDVFLEAVADPGWAFAGWSGDTETMADPGSMTTTITVLGNHAIEATFTQGAVLHVSPTVLDLGTDLQSASFNISNLGTGTLFWEIEGEIPEWLEISKRSGELASDRTETIVATVTRAVLAPGQHSTYIPLVSNGGEEEVAIYAEVAGENPLLGLEPDALHFQTSTIVQSAYIQNVGAGTLHWDSVSDLPSWLNVEPKTGSLSAGRETNISISVTREGLSPGEYLHVLRFESNGGQANLAVSMIVPAPLRLTSPFSYLPPTIDGELYMGEWNRSAIADLGNGYIRVQNDASCLYMLLDFVGDTEDDPADSIWVTFDVNGDSKISRGIDVNYRASGLSEDLTIQHYMGEAVWMPEGPSHSTVGHGYGPSLQSRYSHGIWELAFSLPELSAEVGDTLRAGIRMSSAHPFISQETPQGFTSEFSGLIEINLSTTDLDLLILSDEDFLDELVPLKKHKDRTDMETYVQSWQSLNKSFGPTGMDVQERIKRGIAAYEEACGIRYLMLVGDSDRFPVRYCKIYDPTHWGHSFAPADLYYADLYEEDGGFEDWDSDGDGLFGEMNGIPWHSGDSISSINLDDVDYHPDVAVGRVPASTESEVTTYVDKVISYEFSSHDSSWFKDALMIVPAYHDDEHDTYEDYPGTWETMEYISSNLSSQGFDTVKLYDSRITDLPAGASEGDPNRNSINEELNEGVGFVSFGGHGNTDLWAHVYTSGDMNLNFGPSQRWHDYFCLGDELPAVGDFNGDGKDDIAAFVRDSSKGSARGDVYVAVSTGSGFGPGQIWHGNFCLGDQIPRVGDFNGDGKDDVACFARNQSDVYVAISTGSAFKSPEKWQSYFCLPGEWPDVGDFNGDGKDDIVTFIKGTKSGSAANDVYVSLSNGTAFLPGQSWHGSFSWGSEIPMTGDFDGDGKDDIITFKRSVADVIVALSTGTKFGGISHWHRNFCYPAEEPGIGDFDGDGKDDMVCFNLKGGGKVWVSLSSGSKFQTARCWTSGFCTGNETPLTGDFKGHGSYAVINFIRDEGVGSRRGDVNVSFPIKLDNADRLPVVFAGACSTAHFHYSGKHLDVDGEEFDSSVECPPCCGWKDNRCWPKNPDAAEAPIPAAIQRNGTKNYDSDSLAEHFLVKRDVGAIGYIGCYTGAQPPGYTLGKYLFEAYKLSSKPAILGLMWNRALDEFIDHDFGINPAWSSTWHAQAYYHHAQKYQLYGDPSLRVGGVPKMQREDLAGNWGMAHDGWLGNLSIWKARGDPIEGTPNIRGNYTGADGTHGVEGWMNTWEYGTSGPEHRIDFLIDFQDTLSTADDQRFEGYLFTQGGDAMAGVTWWHGTPFGFYSLKNQAISLEIAPLGTIELSDFLGTYDANINGARGTLELWSGVDSGGFPNVEGRYTSSDGKTHDVWGHVTTPSHVMPQSWGPNHKIEFYIDYSGGIFTGIYQKFEGYLFTQSGGAMAGITSAFGHTFGFYAVKQTKHAIQVESGPGGSVSIPGTGCFLYQSGEEVELSAKPSTGFKFSIWTGDIDTLEDPESASTTMTIYGNHSINATFTRAGYQSTGPVVIDGPHVKCGTEWALVTWTTDESADGTVRYDTQSGDYRYSESHAGSSKVHSVNITGLQPSTAHRFQVISTDQDGNTVTSEESFFVTQSVPDIEDPVVSLSALEGTINGTRMVMAEAADNSGVDRVEFYLNGIKVFTDYSAPYQWPFDTTAFIDGDYTIVAKAHDDYGKVAQDSTKVQTKNTPDPAAPYVHISSWGRSDDYVTFWIDLLDDNGLSTAHVYVDGVQMQFEGFSTHPNKASIEFKWDIRSVPKGIEYRIGAMAYDIDGKTGLDTQDILLPAAPDIDPKLVVTSRKVTRNQNTFLIEITVKNVGSGNATEIVLEDYLRLFQPISRNTTSEDYISEYNPNAKWWYCLIMSKTDISAGESRTFSYNAVPVMLQSGPFQAKIDKLGIWYEGHDDAEYSSSLKTPLKYTTGGEAIQTAYLNSLKAANYLIVTNPSRMLYYHKKRDIQGLLSTTAKLAMIRHGALGYLDVNSASAFDKLISSGGTWAKKLSPSFSKVGEGYLLIVGETEIVPSNHEYGFDIDWKNSPNTKHVRLTDHPYSDTTNDGVPDLIVGRIIGDALTDLTATINLSISAHLGLTSYDRSDALVVSGTGYKESTFVKDAADWSKTLQGKGVTTSELHLKWYSTENQKGAALNQSTPGKDTIVYTGHGNTDGWDDVQCGFTNNPSAINIPNHFPLDFGGTSPVVLAIACLTGNYEAMDDYSIAEGFLHSGAAVYIGSTELSSIQQGSKVGGHFLKNWDSSESIGKAFLDTERDRWNGDKYARLFVWEFNIYGDPKFGAIPSLASGADPDATEIAPELVMEIPGYTVDKFEGLDHVLIPGGRIWMEEGKPQIPYYSERFLCPAGAKVQGVSLSETSETSTSTGLNLPLTENEVRGFPADSDPPVDSGSYPAWDYLWPEIENPDGTSELVLQVFPFKYDPSTKESSFRDRFTFAIDYIQSDIAITDLNTDKDEYWSGERVGVEMAILNPGTGHDLIADVCIRRFASGELVDGLLFRTLDDLTGAASCGLTWDPQVEPGHYYVEAEIRDSEGLVLDRRTVDFHLGIRSCELAGHDVEIENGSIEGVSMAVHNTGDLEISGKGVFIARDESGATIWETTQSFENLSPRGVIDLGDACSINLYRVSSIAMYVLHDGRSVDPVVWTEVAEPPVLLLLVLFATGWAIAIPHAHCQMTQTEKA